MCGPPWSGPPADDGSSGIGDRLHVQDFDSLRLRLQNLVRSVFPEWTEFNVASLGNLLVELYAFVGDPSRARPILGWRAVRDVEDGLRDLVAAFARRPVDARAREGRVA
jgi:nucleoside-diphosphate-sugar epimerase